MTSTPPEGATAPVTKPTNKHGLTGCPPCRGDRTPLFWSKAGMTYRLCDRHLDDARAERRLRARFDRIRKQTFTMVRMDER